MVLINDNSTVLVPGDAMPAFALPATDGTTVDSAQLQGSVFVIIFSCNHCPYAQAYEDRIIALAREFQPQGAVFVLISSNDPTDYPEDSFEAMKEKSEQKNYPFPYCFDESQDIARAFGALCTPHCFVFDPFQKLKYKGCVDDSWKDPSAVTERNLYDAVVAVLAGKDPPKSEANAIGCSIKWKSV